MFFKPFSLTKKIQKIYLFIHICFFQYCITNAVSFLRTDLSKIKKLLILHLNLRNHIRKTFKFRLPL